MGEDFEKESGQRKLKSSPNISPKSSVLYLPSAPAGDASEGVRGVLAGSESSPTVSMTGATARPASSTQLAGVETADSQGQREGKLQTADPGTTPPGGSAGLRFKNHRD